MSIIARWRAIAVVLCAVSLWPVASMAKPTKGSHVLHFQMVLLPDTPLSSAESTYSYYQDSTETIHGAKLTGASLGYGKFITDNLELGIMLCMLRVIQSNGASLVKAFGVAPFLHKAHSFSEQVGVYANVSAGYHLESPNSDMISETYTLAGGFGLELFPLSRLSVRLGPFVEYLYSYREKDGVAFRLIGVGMNGTVTAYF
jgi:hypothetical protein